MAEYFSMGSHGGFIWSAWGIAIAVLSVLVVASVRSMRARERELARMEAEININFKSLKCLNHLFR